MIRVVEITNFKSIEHLELRLGAVNVLIGENGGGKSNILEAIGFGAAAATNRLGKEFLALRGLRITSAPLVRAAFAKSQTTEPVRIAFTNDATSYAEYRIANDNTDYGKWEARTLTTRRDGSTVHLTFDVSTAQKGADMASRLAEMLRKDFEKLGIEKLEVNVTASEGPAQAQLVPELASYMVYAPQMAPLRFLEQDSLVEPLGVHGEGLFKLLQNLQASGYHDELCEHLSAIDWFQDVEAVEVPGPLSRAIRIRDHYLSDEIGGFDQHSANEGFLFFLFYACLFMSPDTPTFFAIDNVENALNPKLCTHLMSMIAKLAKRHGKQVILTTHNPSILDGLDLKDDEQRLFAVGRTLEGRTSLRRIEFDKGIAEKRVRLSEAFLRGYLGGLPSNF